MQVADHIGFQTLVTSTDKEQVKKALNSVVWSWFDSHKDTVLYTFKKWMFSFDIKVSQAEPVFALMFGAHP